MADERSTTPLRPVILAPSMPTPPELEPRAQTEVELRMAEGIAELEALFPELEGPEGHPFVSYAWLAALENARCVGADVGWLPRHIVVSVKGDPIAVAPAYVKGNSEGEFIFDWGWANAAHRAGIEYYPKLLVAVPFTPATGPRVLVRRGADRDLAIGAVAAAVRGLPKTLGISSAHMLFPGREQAEALAERGGLLHRVSVQYQWHNRGYATFEDFLATLPTKKRTQIRRERKAMRERGITIETLREDALVPALVDDVFELYAATVDKFHYGRRYLNRAFFAEVLETMKSSVEIVVARDESGAILAGAFNVRGKEALYGRYWGTRVDVPFLHFNVCYYHPIDECIARGTPRFEPGAGGEHKLVRGFEPTLTHSLHRIEHPRLRGAITDFVEREREAILSELEGSGADD
jgi:predicted N-acyltransferase